MENNEEKTHEEASNLFHNIMKTLVNDEPKAEVKKEEQKEPMTKKQWEDGLIEFESVYYEIEKQVKKYVNGSNKKIRSEAETELRYLKTSVEYLLIKKYPDTYSLFVGGESGFHAAANLHESMANHHIVGDLRMLILDIKGKIKSFEE